MKCTKPNAQILKDLVSSEPLTTIVNTVCSAITSPNESFSSIAKDPNVSENMRYQAACKQEEGRDKCLMAFVGAIVGGIIAYKLPSLIRPLLKTAA